MNKILGRGLGSTQSKGRTPNSWSTGACPCGLWSMTSKPFMSVHTGRLLPTSLSYGDVSPSAAMETQQSVTPQDRTRDVVVNPTLIVQSLRHWTHGRWVYDASFYSLLKFFPYLECYIYYIIYYSERLISWPKKNALTCTAIVVNLPFNPFLPDSFFKK